MGQESNISWTTHTSSPWFGCSRVSPGCTNCYAEKLTIQKGWAGWGDNSPRRRSVGFWKDAYRYNKQAAGLTGTDRPRMFTSLMDWLDPIAPVEWLADFLKVIHDCQNLDWLLLTKRPELWKSRMLDVMLYWAKGIGGGDVADWLIKWQDGKSPQNVWFGVTCENQSQVAYRWDAIRKIPARIKWASCEPLLEQIMLKGDRGGITYNYLTYHIPHRSIMQGFDWIVIGGESGSKRRDCGVDAIISLAEQCRENGTPCFVKQDCAQKPGQQGRIPEFVWSLKQYPA